MLEGMEPAVLTAKNKAAGQEDAEFGGALRAAEIQLPKRALQRRNDQPGFEEVVIKLRQCTSALALLSSNNQ